MPSTDIDRFTSDVGKFYCVISLISMESQVE